jgi:hypothetical protein
MNRQQLPADASGSASPEEVKMAKIRKESNTAISLFPFLSILACTIGTLILILAGMVLGQIGSGASYKQLEGNKEKVDKEIIEWRKMIAEADILAKLLEDYRKQAQQKGLPPSPDEIEKTLAILQEKKRVQQRVKELENELGELKKSVSKIDGNLKKAEGVTIRLRQEQKGLGKGLIPNYVDCKANELVIYPQEKIVRKSDISNSFRTFVQSVGRRKDQSIFFLVRPSGVGTFDAAKMIIEDSETKYGYEAVPEFETLEFEHHEINQ